MNHIKNAARKMGLGKAALRLYHRPLGLLRQSITEGGPFEQYMTFEGEKSMRLAAEELAPLAEPLIGPSAEVSFLTGPKFWHQTVFCFLSLQQVCPFRIIPIIYSDGHLDDECIHNIRRVVPWAEIVTNDVMDETIDKLLPESEFPSLRARRRNYPHLRKLIDLHLGRTGFSLVADSDMLFFRKPETIINWFEKPHGLYMQDIGTFYGYPIPYLEGLTGRSVPEQVNVGLYALNSGLMDWEKIEYWCRKQIEDFGPHYLQEQALTAMVLADASATALPKEDYIVKPTLVEGQTPTGVLHHYVAESKRSYFQNGWRKICST